MKVVLEFIGILCILNSTFAVAETEVAGPVIEIWHSFDGVNFHFRSSFTPSKIETWFRHTIIKDGYNGVPAELESSFKEAVRINGLYTIRVSSDPYNPTSAFVIASVPVCELFKYGFREEIMIHLNGDNSKVVGLDYSATPTPMVRTCDAEKVIVPVLFQTKMKEAERVLAQVVPLLAQGPRPPYLSNVKLAGPDGIDHSSPKKDQSFLVKYWYVVLPMFLFVVFGGGGGASEAPDKATSSAATTAAK